MEEELLEIANEIYENTLIIGVNNENVINNINKNKKINKLYLLEKNKLFTCKHKVISIKKLEKLLNKNKIDEIICNYNYKKMLDKIPPKFYLTGRLYLYGLIFSEDVSKIEDKYSYYTKNIDIKEFNGQYLITVGKRDNKNYSSGGFMELFSSLFDILTAIK